MAVNPTTFTPGPGDADWDGIDHRHVRDLETIRKNFPSQQLKLFRHKDTGKLMEYRAGFAVFYLSADGQEWCVNCAEDAEANPPIIAAQTTGHKDVDPIVRVCSGCGKHIHPIRIVRQNANARYIYNFQTGSVMCIGFETPIAMYIYDSHLIYNTDINWSMSMSKQLGRFDKTMRDERRKQPESAELSYPKEETCKQEQLDDVLFDWTGDVRLVETRSAHENYNLGVGYRVNTRQYIGRYDDLRTILTDRKTHKMVITDKGEGTIQ